jgi:ubiquinone/menaquinone biosynthesis C-methylase UbiE
MNYAEQKNYFETAYNTGSDLWTDKLYHSKALEYISMIPANSLTLDLGTGRGRLAFAMAEMGLRVIGLEYIDSLIEVNNTEVQAKNLEGKIKFVKGDALDISFADVSFDAITDIGLLQHLHREDWPKYSSEINRVLKSGGYVVNISLSRDTASFYDFHPKESADGDYEKYGAFFHFFTPEELSQVYGINFQIVKQETFYIEKGRENFLVTLLRKN